MATFGTLKKDREEYINEEEKAVGQSCSGTMLQWALKITKQEQEQEQEQEQSKFNEKMYFVLC